jgi:hypothetical protein
VGAHTLTKHAEKFKQTMSGRKLMATVFWDRKGVPMVEFMQQGTTMTSEKKNVEPSHLVLGCFFVSPIIIVK